MLPLGWFAARSIKRRDLVTLAIAATSLCLALPAAARSGGVPALGCDTCHSGGKAANVTLTADAMDVAVGQSITLTIGVSQANGPSAGFYLTTAFDAPGSFEAVEAGTAGSRTEVMHTAPRAGTAGTTTFKARWTATARTGVAFVAYALSANGDKTNRGDGAGSAKLELAVGCVASTYYIDQDGDGYGSTDPAYATRKDCTAPAGYAEKTGDCDDFRADVRPNAPELCDLRDNDCDGNADEDVVEQTFCEDRDGDGHGREGGATKVDCKPVAGFALCDRDCDDGSKGTYPGAAETCDGYDNDCDGEVDDGVRQICGVGLCSRYALGCTSGCTPGDPFVEICNGYDDDCDGVIDNGSNAALCGASASACVEGRCTGEAAGSGGGSAGGSASGSGGGPASVSGQPATVGLPPPDEASCSLATTSRTTGSAWVMAALALLRLARKAFNRSSHRSRARQSGAAREALASNAPAHAPGAETSAQQLA